MLKKNVWIVALLAALAMMFVGCGGDFEPEVDLEDLVINGRDVKLMAIGGNAGNSVDGNKYTLNWAGPADATSSGFGFKFDDLPGIVPGYKTIEIEVRINAVTATSAVCFTVKKNTAMGDLAGYGGGPKGHADFEVGDRRRDEAESGQWPMKLFDDGMYFQFNPWNPNWDGKNKGAVSFTIEVVEVILSTGSGEEEEEEEEEGAEYDPAFNFGAIGVTGAVNLPKYDGSGNQINWDITGAAFTAIKDMGKFVIAIETEPVGGGNFINQWQETGNEYAGFQNWAGFQGMFDDDGNTIAGATIEAKGDIFLLTIDLDVGMGANNHLANKTPINGIKYVLQYYGGGLTEVLGILGAGMAP